MKGLTHGWRQPNRASDYVASPDQSDNRGRTGEMHDRDRGRQLLEERLFALSTSDFGARKA